MYTEAIADIKRTVLRVIEQPIRGMGMNSPELLLLVENCPKGAETLVTRCLHSLTDKGAPGTPAFPLPCHCWMPRWWYLLRVSPSPGPRFLHLEQCGTNCVGEARGCRSLL